MESLTESAKAHETPTWQWRWATHKVGEQRGNAPKRWASGRRTNFSASSATPGSLNTTATVKTKTQVQIPLDWLGNSWSEWLFQDGVCLPSGALDQGTLGCWSTVLCFVSPGWVKKKSFCCYPLVMTNIAASYGKYMIILQMVDDDLPII